MVKRLITAVALLSAFLGGCDSGPDNPDSNNYVEVIEVRSNHGDIVCAVTNTGGIDCDW